MTEVPFLPSTPARFSTQLSGREVTFEQRWNESHQAWYFDMLEADETVIVAGIRIAIGTFMARWSEHPLLVRGALMVQDTSRSGIEAGYDDLGVRIKVWYATDAELAMARALRPGVLQEPGT